MNMRNSGTYRTDLWFRSFCRNSCKSLRRFSENFSLYKIPYLITLKIDLREEMFGGYGGNDVASILIDEFLVEPFKVAKSILFLMNF